MGSAYTNRSLKLEERFYREAEIAKALSHPYIADTFHSGISEQGPYLVQEFVHGQSLRSIATSVADDTGHFDVPLAAHIVSKVAEALHYLHEFKGQGLVHRDVTPENVMLSFKGDVKLIDFGVAKSTTNDPNLTAVGRWVGKPHWTAPELFKGGKLDRRADLYALGLMLWYLLSGKDPAATMEHTIGDKDHYPPPSRFHPGVPPELDAIVRKALSTDPAQRYQTADAFQRALATYVPIGFQSRQVLSALLGRYSSPKKEEFLKELLATGIPLLSKTATQLTQTERTISDSGEAGKAPRSLGRVALTLLAMVVIVSTVLYVSRRSKVSKVQPALPVPIAKPSIPTPQTPMPTPAPDAALAPAVALLSPDAAPTIPTPLPTKVREQSKTPVTARARHEDSPKADAYWEEAQEAFERSELPKALSLARMASKEGGGAKAYILIGIILAMQRDIPGAQIALEKALELSPGNKEAMKHLERLSR
jgi:serine/threonine protein kinase